MRLSGWTSGCVLLKKMVEKAEQETEYNKNFCEYILGRGQTLKLRELAKPFGGYWEDMDFLNAVDSIDSAKLLAR